MQLFSSFLFAVSASLDAFIVGITYGIRRVHILFWQNMLVSLITLAGTVLSIGLGRKLSPLLPPQAARAAGSSILILLGAYYIIKFMILSLKKYLNDKQLTSSEIQKASAEKTDIALTLRETLLLGAALSVNNMGIGIGASIAGLQLVPTAIITLVLSVALLLAGNRLGKIHLLRIADRFSDPLSGLLLIGLGLYEWLI